MTDLMTVLVCGGRDYADKQRVFNVLNFNRAKIRMIVHGAAKGADTFAGLWAAENDVPCLRVPAEWKRYGKKAGAIRNRLMLQLGEPDLVVAFPGGVGTAMMVGMAKKAGVRVIDLRPAAEHDDEYAAKALAHTPPLVPPADVLAAACASETDRKLDLY